MAKKLKSIFKDEFYRNILTLTSGTVIAQMVPILISPVLTRIYTPQDFGVLALFLSIATIASILVTGRYELSIVLPKEHSKGLNLTVLSIVLSLGISVFLFVAILIFQKEISTFTGSKLGLWLLALPISFFLLGTNQSLNYWNNRKKKFKIIASSKVVKNVANALASLGLGILKFGHSGLILSLLLGQFLSVCVLIKSSHTNSLGLFNKVSKHEIKELAIRYRDFPRVNMLSALLNSLSIELPVVLLVFYFNPIMVGFYALAQKTLQAPMALVGSSVGQVYFQKASEQSLDREGLKSTTFNLYKQLIQLGTLPISIVLFFAPDLFSIVFGEEWREAGVYAQALSVWTLFVFISSPLSNLLTVFEKHKQNVYFNLGLLFSRVSSLVIGALYFTNELVTIVLYGAVGALVWLIFIYYLLGLVGLSAKMITRTTFILILKWSSPVFFLWLIIKSI